MESGASTSSNVEPDSLEVQNNTSSALFAAQFVKWKVLTNSWSFYANQHKGSFKESRDSALLEIAKVLGLPQEAKFMNKFFNRFRKVFEGKLQNLIRRCVKLNIPPEKALELPYTAQWVKDTERHVKLLPKLIKKIPQKPEDRKAEFVGIIVDIANQIKKMPNAMNLYKLARSLGTTYLEVYNMWLRIAEVATWRLENHMTIGRITERGDHAAMDKIDWEVVDLLILYQEIRDLVTDESLSCPATVASLECLSSMVARYEIENIFEKYNSENPLSHSQIKEELHKRWCNLYKEYDKSHSIHMSIILLQRRWYDLKRSTARVIRARINNTTGASPHQLYIDIAAKFSSVVTRLQLPWFEMVKKDLVVTKPLVETETEEEAENSRCKCESFIKAPDIKKMDKEDDDDVIILENEVETIDIWSDDDDKEQPSDDDDEKRLIIDDNPSITDDISACDNVSSKISMVDGETNVTRLNTSSHNETEVGDIEKPSLNEVNNKMSSVTEVEDKGPVLSKADDKIPPVSENGDKMTSVNGVYYKISVSGVDDGTKTDNDFQFLTISDDDDDEGALVIDDRIDLDQGEDINQPQTNEVNNTTKNESLAKEGNTPSVLKPKLNVIEGVPNKRNKPRHTSSVKTVFPIKNISPEFEKVLNLAKMNACKKLDDELKNQLKLIEKHDTDLKSKVKKETELNLVTDNLKCNVDVVQNLQSKNDLRRSLRKRNTNKNPTSRTNNVSNKKAIDVLQLTPRCLNFGSYGSISPLELLQKIDPNRAEATVIFDDSDEEVNKDDNKTIISLVDDNSNDTVDKSHTFEGNVHTNIKQDESPNANVTKIKIHKSYVETKTSHKENHQNVEINERSASGNFDNNHIKQNNQSVHDYMDGSDQTISVKDNSNNEKGVKDNNSNENNSLIARRNIKKCSENTISNRNKTNVMNCSNKKKNFSVSANSETNELLDKNITNKGNEKTVLENETNFEPAAYDGNGNSLNHQQSLYMVAAMEVNDGKNVKNESVSAIAKNATTKNVCKEIENCQKSNVIENELNTNDEQKHNKVNTTDSVCDDKVDNSSKVQQCLHNNGIVENAQMEVDNTIIVEFDKSKDIDADHNILKTQNNVVENELFINEQCTSIKQQNKVHATDTACGDKKDLPKQEHSSIAIQMESDNSRNMENGNTNEIIKDAITENECSNVNIEAKNLANIIETKLNTNDDRNQNAVVTYEPIDTTNSQDLTIIADPIDETAIKIHTNVNKSACTSIKSNEIRVVDHIFNESIQTKETDNTNVTIDISITNVSKDRSTSNKDNTLEEDSINENPTMSPAMIGKIKQYKNKKRSLKNDPADLKSTTNTPINNVEHDKIVLETEPTLVNSETNQKTDSWENDNLNISILKEMLKRHGTDKFLDYLHKNTTHTNIVDDVNEASENKTSLLKKKNTPLGASKLNNDSSNLKSMTKTPIDYVRHDKSVLETELTSDNSETNRKTDLCENDNINFSILKKMLERYGTDKFFDYLHKNTTRTNIVANVNEASENKTPLLKKKNTPLGASKLNNDSSNLKSTTNTAIDYVPHDKTVLETEPTSDDSETNQRTDSCENDNSNFSILKEMLKKHGTDKFLDYLHKNITHTASENKNPLSREKNTSLVAAEVNNDNGEIDEVDMSPSCDRIDEDSNLSVTSDVNSNPPENCEIDPKLLMTTRVSLVKIDEIYPHLQTKTLSEDIDVINNENNVDSRARKRKTSTSSEYIPTDGEFEPSDNECDPSNNECDPMDIDDKVDNSTANRNSFIDSDDEPIYKTRGKIVRYINSDESDIPSDENEKTEYMPSYKVRRRIQRQMFQKQKMLDHNIRKKVVLNRVDFNANRNEDCNIPTEGTVEDLLKYCKEVRVVLERVPSGNRSGHQRFVRKVRLPDKSSLLERPTAHVAPLTASNSGIKAWKKLPTQSELDKLLQDLMKNNTISTITNQEPTQEMDLNQNANKNQRLASIGALSIGQPTPIAYRKLNNSNVNDRYINNLDKELNGLFSKISPSSGPKKKPKTPGVTQIPEEPEPSTVTDDNGYNEWVRQKNLTKRFFDFPQNVNAKRKKGNAGPKSKKLENRIQIGQTTVARQQTSTPNITTIQSLKRNINQTQPTNLGPTSQDTSDFVIEKTVSDTVKIISFNPRSLLKPNLILTKKIKNSSDRKVSNNKKSPCDGSTDLGPIIEFSDVSDKVLKYNKSNKKCVAVDIPIESYDDVVKDNEKTTNEKKDEEKMKQQKVEKYLEESKSDQTLIGNLIGKTIIMPENIEKDNSKIVKKNSVEGSSSSNSNIKCNDKGTSKGTSDVKIKAKKNTEMQNTSFSTVSEDINRINVENGHTNNRDDEMLSCDNFTPIITNVMSLADAPKSQNTDVQPPVPKKIKKNVTPIPKEIVKRTKLVNKFHDLAAKANTLLDNTERTLSSAKAFLVSYSPDTTTSQSHKKKEIKGQKDENNQINVRNVNQLRQSNTNNTSHIPSVSTKASSSSNSNNPNNKGYEYKEFQIKSNWQPKEFTMKKPKTIAKENPGRKRLNLKPQQNVTRIFIDIPKGEKKIQGGNLKKVELEGQVVNTQKVDLKGPVVNTPSIEPNGPVVNTSIVKLEGQSENTPRSKLKGQIVNTTNTELKKQIKAKNGSTTKEVALSKILGVVHKGSVVNTPKVDPKVQVGNLTRVELDGQSGNIPRVKLEVEVENTPKIAPKVLVGNTKEFKQNANTPNVKFVEQGRNTPIAPRTEANTPVAPIMLTMSVPDNTPKINTQKYISIAPRTETIPGPGQCLDPVDISTAMPIIVKDFLKHRLNLTNIELICIDGDKPLFKINKDVIFLTDTSIFISKPTYWSVAPKNLSVMVLLNEFIETGENNMFLAHDIYLENKWYKKLNNDPLIYARIYYAISDPSLLQEMGSRNEQIYTYSLLTGVIVPARVFGNTVKKSPVALNSVAPNSVAPNVIVVNMAQHPNNAVGLNVMAPNNAITIPVSNIVAPNNMIPNIQIIQRPFEKNTAPKDIPINNLAMNPNLLNPNMSSVQSNFPIASSSTGNSILLSNNTTNNTIFSNMIDPNSIKEEPDITNVVYIDSDDND